MVSAGEDKGGMLVSAEGAKEDSISKSFDVVSEPGGKGGRFPSAEVAREDSINCSFLRTISLMAAR